MDDAFTVAHQQVSAGCNFFVESIKQDATSSLAATSFLCVDLANSLGQPKL